MIEIKEIRIDYAKRAKGIPNHGGKTKVYIFVKDESVMENFVNRHNRPVNFYRKEIIPQVLEKLGLPVETKVSWRQRCGCTCPCSPGFLIDNHYNKEVFVTI